MSDQAEVGYEECGFRDFQGLFDSGALNSSALVHYYLGRIARLDKSGPLLNAALHLNAEAPRVAEALDLEREKGGSRGILHGIPLMIKANINIAEPSLPTTAGSLALRGFVAPSDAALVARLKKAGAIILGNTNMSEWANFRSDRSTSGWSSEGGQTRNPYALDRNPSGSSSGSAVAVSANLCAAAIGTETDGSIVSPASANGIVGLKPTLGLVPAEGIIPISASQDTAGPMARKVEDAAYLLAAMMDGGSAEDLVAFLEAQQGQTDLRGIRIGIARSLAGFDLGVDRIFDAALDVLRALGAELVESDFAVDKELAEAEYEVMLYEFKDGLEKYLRNYVRNRGIRDLSDLIAFNRDQGATVMPWFGQEIFVKAATKGPLTEDRYLRARKTCIVLAREKGIDASIDSLALDALVAPSGGPAWKTDYYCGDHYLGGSAAPAAIAGYPNLSLPAGFLHGLPVGISLFGPSFSEKKLLRIALAFEAATRARRKPSFAPTLDTW